MPKLEHGRDVAVGRPIKEMQPDHLKWAEADVEAEFKAGRSVVLHDLRVRIFLLLFLRLRFFRSSGSDTVII